MLSYDDALDRLEREGLSLGPFGTTRVIVELPAAARVDALLTLAWEGHEERFAAQYLTTGTPKRVSEAVAHLRRYSTEHPLVLAPYLSPAAIERLREADSSGADLSGNYWIHVPGRWLVSHDGEKNRYPTPRGTRNVYAGTSSLVGRMLLLQPDFESVNAIVEAIRKRGGSITQPTVSRALATMEEHGLVEKRWGSIELKRPEDLLDRLVRAARQRNVVKRLRYQFHMEEDDAWAAFRSLAAQHGWQWARVPSPPTQARFSFGAGNADRCYVSSLHPDTITRTLDGEAEDFWASVEFAEAPGPEVFFDASDHCTSLLQTYLDLMQGGERERHTATALRPLVLPTLV